MLWKLRLRLLNHDLADRFGISVGLVSKIFHSWLRASSEVLKSLVFVPSMNTILTTTPLRSRRFKNMFGIIDCSEIFLQTPKYPELQSVTWSEYKHHNTLKFLVCVAPNSQIIYVSPVYTGKISDKALTVDCGFLSKVPCHSTLMADKGFNIVGIEFEFEFEDIYFKTH